MKMLRLILVLMLGIVSFSAQSAFAATTDTKYHSEYGVKYGINDKFDLFYTPEIRFRDDMSDLYYHQERIGTTFHAHNNLDLSLAGRYIQAKDAKKEWDNCDAYYIEMIAIPKVEFQGFSLSDANKVERRFIENARDRWVYRNLATIGYPIKAGSYVFTPYISDEIYYDFEIDEFNLNWATLGVDAKVTKNFKVGLYYREESSRVGSSDKWTIGHILGTNVTVSF